MAEVQSVIRGDQTGLKDRVDILEKISPEYYAQEKEKIFRRAWLCVAHASDLPEKGGYRVVEVPTFKASLLITRARDGKIRGFHNICRHLRQQASARRHRHQDQFRLRLPRLGVRGHGRVADRAGRGAIREPGQVRARPDPRPHRGVGRLRVRLLRRQAALDPAGMARADVRRVRRLLLRQGKAHALPGRGELQLEHGGGRLHRGATTPSTCTGSPRPTTRAASPTRSATAR